MALVSIFLCIAVYIADDLYLHTEHGFPRFILVCSALFCGIFLWGRYSKVEVVGNCGIAKWFGVHKFYISDVVAITENHSRGAFFLKSTKYHKCIFRVTPNDENIEQLKKAINTPLKGYAKEPIVEKKYRRLSERKKLRQYGQIVENAEIIGGMDLMFGTVIPIYEFSDKQKKHMMWGACRIKENELKQKLHKKCTVYYAPGKSECVMEITDEKRM